MLLRAIVIWLVLAVLANGNGVLRKTVITPRIGEHGGHVVSTVILCALFFCTALVTVRWIGPSDSRDAWLIGAFWVVLAVAFEFLVGHYALGHPWEKLLADYNLSRGRVWSLVLITTLVAPRVAAAIRGMFAPPAA